MPAPRLTPLVASIAALTTLCSSLYAAAPVGELSVVASLRTSPRTKVSGGTTVLNSGAAFIVVHDPVRQRLLVTNAAANRVDVYDVANLGLLGTETLPDQNAIPVASIELSDYGVQPLSVAVGNGLVAISTLNKVKTDPGKVVFFNANLEPVRVFEVGALPDMLTFTPDEQTVLVANEGEPSAYPSTPANDPEGSISVIDLSTGIENATLRTADFHAWNGKEAELRSTGVRVYGPNASASQDLEPEYIAVSKNSKTAWVTLQEANAIAILDVETATVRDVVPLGTKNHNLPGNGLDPSDKDGGVHINTWPVRGLYQPDAIAVTRHRGEDYLVVANEGDSRKYGSYNEESSVSSLSLTPELQALQSPDKLGGLKVTNTLGKKLGLDGQPVLDASGKPIYDQLFSFGARSFSIRDAHGKLLWDSGDQFERITAKATGVGFNTSHDSNTKEGRSPAKGPEPEGVVVGKAFGRTYAFVGLERVGGIFVYDISVPTSPNYVQYINQRDFSVDVTNEAAGDLGPEGMAFISEEQSPTGKPLLVVAHELSGTTTIFEFDIQK